MTLNGAIAELVILREHSMMPEIFKGSLDKVIETISECEEPSAQPEIIRCKDCKYQEKHFYEDRRRKDGGHYIYGCELAEGYSHVCLDDDFCSRAERRIDEIN